MLLMVYFHHSRRMKTVSRTRSVERNGLTTLHAHAFRFGEFSPSYDNGLEKKMIRTSQAVCFLLWMMTSHFHLIDGNLKSSSSWNKAGV